MGGLSGGNQQKVVIGRRYDGAQGGSWTNQPEESMSARSSEVYHLINLIDLEGRAVVLVSSELPD